MEFVSQLFLCNVRVVISVSFHLHVALWQVSVSTVFTVLRTLQLKYRIVDYFWTPNALRPGQPNSGGRMAAHAGAWSTVNRLLWESVTRLMYEM